MNLFSVGLRKFFRLLKTVSKRQIFGVFFSLLLVILPLILVLVYQVQSHSLIKNTYSSLTEVTLFKQKGIETWLQERMADMRALTEPVEFSNLVKQSLIQEESEAFARLANQLAVFQNAYGYGQISLLNTQCDAVYETSRIIELEYSHLRELCQDGINSKSLVVSNFFKKSLPNEKVHFDLVIPVFDQSNIPSGHLTNAPVIGVLVFHVNPHQFLVPYMALLPFNSVIGNSFILQKGPTGLEPLALQANSDKFHEAKKVITVMQPHFEQSPDQGHFYAEAYGKTAFVVYASIANTQWVLVNAVDASGIFSPLYQQLIWIFVIGFVVLFLMGWLLVTQIVKQHLSQETLGLLRSHKSLEKSREYFMGLFMDSPVAYQSLDERGHILEVNQAWEMLFGYYKEEVVGLPYKQFITKKSIPILLRSIPILKETGKIQDVPFTIVRKDGQERQIRLQGRISMTPDTNRFRTHCSLNDVTQILKEQAQQARIVKRTQMLFELTSHAQEMTEEELLQSALKTIEELTDSQMSFLHFVQENQTDIELAAWRLPEGLQRDVPLFEPVCSVYETGIWADSLRNRQAVLLNDYAVFPDKKGVSPIFSDLLRFISVPVMNQQLVCMILGVGNATRKYDAFDVESLQLFGSELYQVILLKRTHKELVASELRFHNLFDQAPVAYQSLDGEGYIQEVNAAWLGLFGYEHSQKEQLIGLPISQFLTLDSNQKLPCIFNDFIERGYVNHTLFEIVRQDGGVREIEVTGRISRSVNQEVLTHCTLVDVTEKNQTSKTLKLAAKVFEVSGEGIMVTDNHKRIVSVNDAFTRILGYNQAEAMGQTPGLIKSGKHNKQFYEQMWQTIDQNGFWQGEVWNRHKDGSLIPEWLSITTLHDEKGQVQNYIGVFADITELKSSEAELQFVALHDGLTHLPNRNKFISNVEYAMAHSKRSQRQFAVLMLDLDRFKNVNDSFGHAFGDEVLVTVAKQLSGIVRDSDMVARLGGDEFAVLMEDLKKPEDAARLARKIIDSISLPITLSNGKVASVGCSIGISLMGAEQVSAEQLIQQADTALYLAKQKGRGTFQYFTAELTLQAQERIGIEVELKNAIRNQELRVYFQPQVELKTGRIKGAEALVRWQHPTLGLVMPGSFIAIAEESDLIAQIGAWVLNETCRLAKIWYDQGVTDLVYAVNVSPKQMLYSDMLALTMNALQEHGLPAEVLELEITESGLLTVGKDEAVLLLEQLRGLGVRIAIDDFGTGYSSLAYLKSLPLDVLKIDKQFVDDIPTDEKGMQIVSTIIAMAHNLKLEVLAEGVETQQQADFLKFKGCDVYQGYLTSRPVAPDVFEREFIWPHRL